MLTRSKITEKLPETMEIPKDEGPWHTSVSYTHLDVYKRQEMCNGVVTFLFNRQLLVYVGDLGVVVYGIISNSALIVASKMCIRDRCGEAGL